MSDRNFEDPVAIATVVLTLGLVFLFLNNRSVFPIAQREPLLVSAAVFLYAGTTAFWLIAQQHPELPILVSRLFTHVVVGTVLVLYLIRVLKLYMNAGIAHERVTHQHGWFIAHRHYQMPSRLGPLALTLTLFHVGLFLISVFTVSPLSANLVPARDVDGSDLSGLSVGAIALVYFFFFLFFATKLRGRRDGFCIKRELKLTGFGECTLIMGWLLKTALNLPCLVVSCGSLILWGSGLWITGSSLVYPLLLAVKDPQFRWLPLSRGNQHQRAESAEPVPSIDEEFPDYEENDSLETMGHQTTTTSSSPPPTVPPPLMIRQLTEEKQERLRHVPLAKFLTYPTGREAFRQFTVREFSVENLLFVEAVKQLRTKPIVTKEDVDKIVEGFVAPASPNQVNLPSHVVKQIFARVEEGGGDYRTLFDEAYDNIMKLMSRDAYRRFQNSVEWQQHVVVFDLESRAASMANLQMMQFGGNAHVRLSNATRVPSRAVL